MEKIIIGARNSKLSLAYVARVKRLILEKIPDIREEKIILKTIKTSGDIHQNRKLSEIGGKNLFCKEIEESLLEEKIDIAVHSLKDMESEENKNLVIGAYVKRNDPRDAFISLRYNSLEEIKKKAVIGSSSRRRELQLKLINPDISVLNIRGNIDTRIKKLEEGKLDAIILAVAGVQSLDLQNKIKNIFSIQKVLPAVGQGIIAVQCRKNNEQVKNILNKINDYQSNLCANAERQMLRVIGGDCETAVGGFAIIENNQIKLRVQLFSDDGKNNFNYEEIGLKDDALKIGQKAGEKILKLAGKEFKKK